MSSSFNRRGALLAGLAGGLASGFPSLAAQLSFDWAKADEIVRQARIPGLAISVARDGILTAFHGAGYASLPFEATVNERTLFHLGSLGKHVTAASVLQLADQGKLSLDQALGEVVKDLPPACARLKLRTLLNQQTGLRDYTDLLTDFDRPIERKTMIEAIVSAPPAFAPGEAWAYSNSNYVLLGWAIEAASGLSYADYVAQRLFAPAKLPRARPDDALQVIENRAEPYDLDGDHFTHEVWLDPAVSHAADGGVLFCAQDLGPWIAALSGGGLLSPAAWRGATAPATTTGGAPIPYGFGWFLDRIKGRPVIWHTGGVPGYGAIMVVAPDAKLSVLVTANRVGTGAALRRLAWMALEAAAPGLTHLGLQPIAADPLDEALTRWLSAPDAPPDPHLLAPEMALVLGNAQAKRRARPAIKAPFTLTPIETYAVGEHRMRRYRLADTLGERAVLAGFTPQGRLFWYGAS